jgi:hypothetical protein
MTTLSKTTNKIDIERRALYLSLSKLLDSGALEDVQAFLRTIADGYPISSRQIENALYQYFMDGATVLMRDTIFGFWN